MAEKNYFRDQAIIFEWKKFFLDSIDYLVSFCLRRSFFSFPMAWFCTLRLRAFAGEYSFENFQSRSTNYQKTTQFCHGDTESLNPANPENLGQVLIFPQARRKIFRYDLLYIFITT